MASRLAVMNAGRIVQAGTPHEIYERPATRFVADFIGIANIFEKDGRRFVLRPEKIALGGMRPATAHAVEGTIVDIAYEGDRSIYHVDVAGTLMTVSAMPNDTHRRGDPIWLGWAADAAHELES